MACETQPHLLPAVEARVSRGVSLTVTAISILNEGLF
jgi:hypothetical protein